MDQSTNGNQSLSNHPQVKAKSWKTIIILAVIVLLLDLFMFLFNMGDGGDGGMFIYLGSSLFLAGPASLLGLILSMNYYWEIKADKLQPILYFINTFTLIIFMANLANTIFLLMGVSL